MGERFVGAHSRRTKKRWLLSMQDKEYQWAEETQRLERTLALARAQYQCAVQQRQSGKADLRLAKEDLRENAQPAIAGLHNAQNFEDLIELSQFTSPIAEKMADVQAAEKKIAQLEKVMEAPYFARVDFRFDCAGDAEPIYIGRTSLLEEHSYEIVVYDWRSPIAGLFYRFGVGPAHYQAPRGRIQGEMTLKRQYEIQKGQLLYFFDADVQVMDEFLRKMLAHNASPRMKSIVETIQRGQDAVIRDLENDLMMVQGVAGSGKTSVALHRAAYLMYRGLSEHLQASQIVILSPNAVFEQYIDHVLPELGEENVTSVVMEELICEVLHEERVQSRQQFLETVFTDAPHAGVAQSSMAFKTSAAFVQLLNRLIDEAARRWIPFADVYVSGVRVAQAASLRKKVLSGRRETPLAWKLAQLEESIASAAGAAHFGQLPPHVQQKVQRFTQVDAAALYQRLFCEDKVFFHLASGMELPVDIKDILRFTRENLSAHVMCGDDAAAMAYLSLKMHGVDDRNIRQVVIDEAQDYAPLHYEILNLLYPNAKYTVLGDVNQTLERPGGMSLYTQIETILHKRRSALVVMDQSFRCTQEILSYSAHFLPQQGEVRHFNRSGEAPQLHAAQDMAALCETIVQTVQQCLQKGDQSIGLICKTQRGADALFALLRGRLPVRRIGADGGSQLQGVCLLPVYLSKGLEFDTVLLCDADAKTYGTEDDRRLLYIACTRALHRLHLFCVGEPSALLPAR